MKSSFISKPWKFYIRQFTHIFFPSNFCLQRGYWILECNVSIKHNYKEKQEEKTPYTRIYIPENTHWELPQRATTRNCLTYTNSVLFSLKCDTKFFFSKKISYGEETAKALLTKCITSLEHGAHSQPPSGTWFYLSHHS